MIALQINTWNEERKKIQGDREFLTSLRIELSQDISGMERNIRQFEEFNSVVAAALKILEAKAPPHAAQRDTLDLGLFVFVRLTPFKKNISRNDEFIGQGRLEQIDRELNQNCLNYLDNLNLSATLYTRLGDALKEIEITQIHAKVEFRQKAGAIEEVKYDFDELQKNLPIKNGLVKSVVWRGYYIDSARDLIKDARSLIARIDVQLGPEQAYPFPRHLRVGQKLGGPCKDTIKRPQKSVGILLWQVVKRQILGGLPVDVLNDLIQIRDHRLGQA